MSKEIIVRPINSVIFLSDPNINENIPQNISDSPVTFTDNCIAIWTAPEMDSETTVAIVEYKNIEDADFDGFINVPNKVISLGNSLRERFFSKKTANKSARVRIKLNDYAEPSEIQIGIE